MNPPTDFDNLPEELKQKLAEIEAAKPYNKQIQLLREIAGVSEQLVQLVDEANKDNSNNSVQLSEMFSELQETLQQLVSKEDPEMPNYAQPVVDAVGTLEKNLSGVIKKLQIQPTFKPNIQVDSPEINVAAPNVDLKGVEKILKTDLPNAFNKAIASITIPAVPATNFTPVVEKLDELSEKLDSIDHASRMKPQFPNQLAVTNPDGTAVSSATVSKTYAQRIDDTTPPITYIGKATPGTATSAASWQIQKIDETSGAEITWADGDSNFNNIWDNRSGLNYV